MDLPPRRAVCGRCRRPLSVCYCAHVPDLATRTRVMLLQHPRERHVAVGTARMAHLALPNSVLRLGIDFSTDPVVCAALKESPPPFLLFPGPRAVDAAALPKDRAVTLIVLDGTWWQARKLLHLNPALAALPQVAFTPRQPSAYRIRRQPAAFCLSTIEALAEVLPLIEPEGASLGRLLEPFHAMVARQERFALEIASGRHRSVRGARRVRGVGLGEGAGTGPYGDGEGASGTEPPRARDTGELARTLGAAWPRLVCVYGEANAWPKRMKDRPAPEIVRWLGVRPATGATFEAIVAPRQPLAPAVPARIGLAAETLRAGDTVGAWQDAWAAFCGPQDVVVAWGPFELGVAANDGLAVPAPHEILDLRTAARAFQGARLRTVEDAAEALAPAARPDTAATPPSPLGALVGRGGVRLRALVAVLEAMALLPAAAISA
jgi:DTW domain-containing protein YfiP